MRRWLVGGALIRHDDGLVLVGNRRRDRSYEWTPPGGVIDAGERLLDGLAREVLEETGLVVEQWHSRCYRVEVVAPDMGWVLRVEAWEAATISGEVRLDDPDGIVEEVRHVSAAEAAALLVHSPPWVAVPVSQWLDGTPLPSGPFRFRVHGVDRANTNIERVS